MSTSPQKRNKPARPAVWRLLGRLAAGSAAAIAALIIWVFTADLGILKPQVERLLSERTGREFRINGELDVLVGLNTVVVARDVSLSDAAWADSRNMLEVAHFEVHVDLWTVLSGPITVRLIDIDDASIQLSRSATNEPNWAFSGSSPRRDDDAAPAGEPAVLFEQLDIDRVQLTYEDPGRDAPIELAIAALDQRRRQDDVLEFDVAGTLGGRSISGSGEIATWTALLRQTDVHFDLVGDLDTVHFEARGEIDDLLAPRRPSVQFSLSGPDVDDLTRMFGFADGGAGDIDLAGALLPQPGGPLSLDLEGNIGESEIDVTGAFSDLSRLDELDLTVLADGPDLSRVVRWFGIRGMREAPFMVDVAARRRGSEVEVERANMVFGEAEFDLSARLPRYPSLDDGSIGLAISGPDIERFRHVFGLPGTAVGAFAIDLGLEVSPDGAESFQGSVVTSLGRAEASGILGSAPDYLGSRIDLKLHAPSLADIGSGWGLTLADAPFDISGSLTLGDDGFQIIEPLVARLGGDTLRLEGSVARNPRLTDADLSFTASGASLAETVSGFADVSGIPDRAYTLAGGVRIREDSLQVDGISGRIGQSILDIDGMLSMRGLREGARFEVSAAGPAFEELFEQLDNVEVTPGEYELSGIISMADDVVAFEDVELERARGSVGGDLSIGLPLSRNHIDFDIRGRGDDIRNVLRRVKGFEADEAPFALIATGTLRNGTWQVQNLQATVGGATASARGELNFNDGIESTQFSFAGEIPSLASLGTIAGHRPREQELSLNGTMTGEAGALLIENLTVELGDSDLSGRIAYRPGTVPQLDIDVTSRSLTIASLTRTQPPDQSVSDDVEPEPDDRRLIPDVRIPFDAMASINASVDVSVDRLKLDHVDLRNLRLSATQDAGVLDVREFSFNPRSGRLEGRLKLDPADGDGHGQIEIVARNFAIGAIEMNHDLLMTGDIDVKLTSTGTDLRSLLGAANGAVFVDARGGRIINRRFLQAVYGDLFQEILNTINPFARNEDVTMLDCVILPYAIDNGQLRQTPNALIRTDKLQFASRGSVDLGTEAIDVTVRSKPRSGLTISAAELVNPFTKVVGTLARPKLAVDEQGVLLTGGAAVATGGLTLLARAAFDRVGQSSDPCNDLSKQAHELLDDRLADWRDTVSADVRD